MKKSNYIISLFSILVITSIIQSTLFSQAPYTIWTARFSGPGFLQQDSATGIAVNSNGNVFVTGWTLNAATGRDIVTIRYNQFTGDSMWVKTYAGVGTSDDVPNAIVADNNAVYITGWTFNPSRDIVTIKYNITDGSFAWVRTYNGTGNGGDYGWAVTVDQSGNVYSAGRSDVGAGGQKFTILKYDASGNMVSGWPCVYMGTLSTSFDEARAIRVDGSGNVYVTGTAGVGTGNDDYLTIKINSGGIVQWAARYNGNANGVDNAIGLVINSTSSSVYVTGNSSRTGDAQDYVTLKYDASGNCLDTAVYNGPASSYDFPSAITKDPADNIYVTGSSLNTSSIYDYATLKYDQNLNQIWLQRYSTGNSNSVAKSLVYDTSGSIYVTGSSIGSGTGYDYLTVRYNAVTDSLMWIKRENGAASGNDYVSGIVTSGPLNIYVAGSANWGSPTGLDFYTIRYSENPNGIIPISHNVPNSFYLSQNYPNPFNPSTSIKFDLPIASSVKLTVYDILGRETASLVNEYLKAGSYEVNWNASDISSGIYFYKLVSSKFTETKKMMLVK
jgi:hypothetical protein